jgi:hypothetical protein
LTEIFDEKEFANTQFAALVAKAEEYGGSKEKLEEMIKSKMAEFDGLLTREATINLIARDEGIQISMDTEPTEKPKELTLAKLAELPKHIGLPINLKCVVTYKSDYELKNTKRGDQVPFIRIRVEDDTGKSWMTLWGDHAKQAKEWAIPYKLLIETVVVKDDGEYGLKLQARRGRTHFHNW